MIFIFLNILFIFQYHAGIQIIIHRNKMHKIMFLGESGTGKTSYISYLLKNREYQSKHLPTVGVEVGVKQFQYQDDAENANQADIEKVNGESQKSQSKRDQSSDGQKHSKKIITNKDEVEYAVVQLWDTAGKHSFHEQICEKFYADMDAFIILVDLSDENTLKSVNYWYQKIKKIRGSQRGFKIGVIANKMDKHHQFGKKDFKNMYQRIDYYTEISLQEKTKDGKASKAEEALYYFIRDIIFNGQLPKISLTEPKSEPSCNCLIM